MHFHLFIIQKTRCQAETYGVRLQLSKLKVNLRCQAETFETYGVRLKLVCTADMKWNFPGRSIVREVWLGLIGYLLPAASIM